MFLNKNSISYSADFSRKIEQTASNYNIILFIYKLI